MRVTVVWIAVAGCCGREAPAWIPVDPIAIAPGSSADLDLAALVTDDKPATLTFGVSSDPAVIAEISGATLTVTTQPDFDGEAVVELTVEDGCGNVASTALTVTSDGATTPSGSTLCEVPITWVSPGSPDAVSVAGAFDDWDVEAHPLAFDGAAWSTVLELAPGLYPYKIVELDQGAFGATEAWSCDPSAPFIQCDADYKQPSDVGFAHDCVPGATSCNSLLVVERCDVPALASTAVDVDEAAGTVHVEASLTGAATVSATVDGAATSPAVDGGRITLDASGLAPGRHTVRIHADGDAGSDALYVPVWIDDRTWSDQVLYFAFVDRMSDGDPTLPGPVGATATGGDYAGGDLQGLLDLLPYLEDLGVTALWISNLQDGADDPWPGDCGLTYSGYHAYWPVDPTRIEEHFGDDAAVRAVIDGAHARGMRVVMDLVANHVHQDHPYVAEHPDWFNPFAACKDSVGGQLNFDRIPETCWFAEYLPDFDYANPEPVVQTVSDAIGWASTYELDGFRVDAVKHMSHAVTWDLSAAIEREVEHGDPDRFYTVGETFDGAERIASYIGPDELDAQFDFPLYYAIRSAFAYRQGDLYGVLQAYDASRASFGDAPMSTFLGNHDVNRFVTDAVTGWQDPCDGGQIRVAEPPTEAWPYDRLNQAWTFLFTMPGVPLVYYGDELGLPGNPDPDNRQPLSWHAGDLAGVTTVDQLAAKVDPNQASVLRHVRALAHARRDHPALRSGGWIEWWRETELIGYARAAGDDHALVIINRSDDPRTLVNGVGFAGLPQGAYTDVLTAQVFRTSGDSLTVPVDPRGSRVLVWSGP
ncbi:MAG: alpha-amylase family glycosyl hydrolase [Myxococcota bacterium]